MKIIKNETHDYTYRRTSSNLLVDKTYLIVAWRMRVLVSTLDAGSPKRKVYVNHFALGICY